MKQKFLLLLFVTISLFQLDAAAQRKDRHDRDNDRKRERYDQKDRRYNGPRDWDRSRQNDRDRDYVDDYDRRDYKCRPMSNDVFYDALNTIKNSSFDNTKLEIANSITAMNCLTADQILTITQVFSFESNRLDYSKNAYNSCADPQNYFKVMNAFTFSSSKEELSEFISNRR